MVVGRRCRAGRGDSGGVPVTAKLPQLIDARGIMVELGVKQASADAIIRWIAREYGVIEPDNLRKRFVQRAHVQAWLEAHTRSAA